MAETGKLAASFTLTGFDVNPEEITAMVGVTPTQTWRTGDLVDPRATVRRKSNGWKVSSESDTAADLGELVGKVLVILRPGWPVLQQLVAQHNALFNCVVHVYDSGAPAISLDKDLIRAVADLGVGVDIDLYCLPGNDTDAHQSNDSSLSC